jgi:type 1 fimbria pilin
MRGMIIQTGLILSLAGFCFAASSTDGVKTFRGQIADSQCALNVHSLTRSHQEMLKSKSMGGTSASCTQFCIKNMGGELVLSSNNDVYRLDSHEAQNFIGLKVKITGTLDSKTNTIHVVKIEVADKKVN